MIHYIQHIIQRSTALFILLVFLLPTAVSFGHSLQGHEHFDTCKVASDTHVHEKDVSCDLGDLQMVKVLGFAFAKAESITVPPPSKTVFFYSYYIVSLDTTTLADRGPPAC